MTFYFLLERLHSQQILKAKEIREELAAYFLSGERIEWQNDCA